MSLLRTLSRTKLYWGLAAIFLVGVLTSPVSSKGSNIFLSYGNLLDVLRQVSITGLIATGMTAVILTAGIDLSVGSIMALCSVVCAMLLTVEGWTPAAAMGLPALALTVFIVLAGATRFVLRNASRAGPDARLDALRGKVVPIALGLAGAGAALWFLLPQVATKFGVLGVLLVAPCVGLMVGAINGIVIVGGRLQPFIVTLAMMVTALGVARLTAGQNNAVLPVYTGSNAVAGFDVLRSLVFGIVPVPGLFFLAAVAIYGAVLRFTPFGRYVYAIGGNEEAARLSGIDVARTKIVTYAISGMLAGVAAVLFVAQDPAGEARRGGRARARRDRGGGHRRHQPDGRARADGRDARRRADLRAAVEPAAAPQHQLEPSAGAEGADHRRGGPDPGAQPRRDHGEPAPDALAGGACGTCRLDAAGRRDRIPRAWRERMMRRRNFLKVAGGTVAGLTVTAYLPDGFARAQDKQWVIGFSQATTIEPWRAQFNKDIIAEAAKNPDVELIVTDGEDRTEKQVADVENLIRQEVDALLISPKELAGLTGVVEQAIDAGIPVFVLDRNVETDRYTQFVGGDNVLIGRAAGEWTVEALGGAGKAAGNVVEIWGGMGTQPAHDRHDGFHELTDKEPGIKYLLNEQSGDWKQDQAYDIMATALRSNEDIDIVYGHNDPMAYGAYLAAKDVGREADIKFIGIDALPGEGVTWVQNGELAATFLYATPGAEGLRQALKFLNGEEVPKTVVLDTMTVTKENAEEILKANGLM